MKRKSIQLFISSVMLIAMLTACVAQNETPTEKATELDSSPITEAIYTTQGAQTEIPASTHFCAAISQTEEFTF